MPKMTVSGLDGFSSMIQTLGESGQDIATRAVYAGAGVAADAVRAAIQALPTESGYMRNGRQRHVVKRTEKQAMLDHLGISEIETVGGKTTARVGFKGYAEDLTTDEYPMGLPVPLIARAVESGSSVRQKCPFVRKAGNASADKIRAAMLEAAYARIDEIKIIAE